jgi:copper chaperone CopZ
MMGSLKIYIKYYFKPDQRAMAFPYFLPILDPDGVFRRRRWTAARAALTLQPSQLEDTMQTATLTIPAMQTEAIAIAVAKALETVNGVEAVHITLAHGRARVGFDESLATPVQLRSAVSAAGFVVADAPASGCCGGCGG